LLYDPIKDRFGTAAARHPFLQRLFYWILGMVFLRNWYVRRTIKHLFPDRSGSIRMLDAGTGFAQWVDYVVRRYPNARIHAVDVKEDYLENASRYITACGREKRVSFETADLTTFVAKDQVDFVLSVDVMEHIEEDEKVFANFARSLKPGGYVLINTPSDLGGSDVHEDSEGSFIGEHVRDGYNTNELAEKLKRAGLEMVSSTYSYGFAGSIAWRFLVKWPMQMLSASFFLVAVLPFYYCVFLPLGLILNALDLAVTNEEGTGLHVVARLPERG